MISKYLLSILLAVVFLAGCQKLFAQTTMKLDKADLLLTTSEAINSAMDVTLHNIANFKTTGFKKQRVHLQDGRIVETSRIWQQGRLLNTNIPLDLVINGEGFFRILQPDGALAYTRNGSMHLSGDGNIVTSNGEMLDPQICLPQDQTSITISSDGTVEVLQSGGTQPQQVGRIELAYFQNPSGLKAIGPTLFVETPASGQPVVTPPGENGAGKIMQGFLEDSNVEILEELTHLRTLQSWKKGVDQALITIQ
jgi:flagellar basal-body rod protein FlgG